VLRTTATGDAGRFAGAAPVDHLIFVLGGDGTVMEAVGALVGTGRPVGILPGGTGNQLARHLGIPLHIGAAVRALKAGHRCALDLGRLGDGRHFALTAGLGLDAALIAGASRRAKRWLGVGAYFLSAARPVLTARPFPVRVVADGRTIEREAALAMIANVGSDDGWLDLCILSPRGLADGVALGTKLLRHDFREDRRMLYVRARDVRIEAPAGVPAQVDGELLAATTLHARVVPKGAWFLGPPR
jgi:diacylglycerol kinase (ATP)